MRTIHRHTLAVLAACAFSTLIGLVPCPSAHAADRTGVRMPLWPGSAPVGNGETETNNVVITIHHPDQPSGTAIVICPGGGYGGLVTGAEGHGIAKWLNEHGITGVVLEYRLPAGRPFVPLLDAQRAIRTVRANAQAWGLKPDRIGIIGFSAGGHLASTAGTHFDARDPNSADPIARVSCRPDFMILIYPVISMDAQTHGGSKLNLLGKDPKPDLLELFSNEKQVTSQTPPAFLAHAKDDTLVSPDNSREFHAALRAHDVASEYLELPSGGHGLNGYKGPMWEAWQKQSLAWLEVQKLFEPATHEAKLPGWPQFRGPGGWPVADGPEVSTHFGPKSNLLWQVELPVGHSSPCVGGDRIFLTAFDKTKLETICLDRRNGTIIWRKPAMAEKFETTHRLGNPAASTAATDGERVYVYFGSIGLLAYSFAGEELWRVPLPTPEVEFGTGTSPIVVGQLVILACNQDRNSFVLAVDRKTGKTVWRKERPEFRRGFSTPFLWTHDRIEELIVPGSVRLQSLDPRDGSERWTYTGTARVDCSSPTAGDGLLFCASWNVGGDVGAKFQMPPFEEYLRNNDKNSDGKLSLKEIPTEILKSRFSQMDLDKDGLVTAEEWRGMAEMFAHAENALLAIRPGGRGDITSSHLAWKASRGLPYVPSTLFYQGRVYTVRDGGMASCYEAKSGKVLFQDERLGALGEYYSSPVAANGRIYLASQRGVVTVLAAGNAFRILAQNDLGEEAFATPAIVDGAMLYRTTKHLFAFGLKGK